MPRSSLIAASASLLCGVVSSAMVQPPKLTVMMSGLPEAMGKEIAAPACGVRAWISRRSH